MKTQLIVTVLLLLNIGLYAQEHPLVGTWKFISAKGMDAEGKAITMDTSIVKEIKVITLTHYIFIAQDVKGDSLIFNRSQAGRLRIEGNKYTEIPLMSSQAQMEKSKTNLTWQIEGDKFIRKGTITLPDGKNIHIDELVFQRVKAKNTYPANPAIGTWNNLTSTIIIDGKKIAMSYPSTKQFQIITPTHWMLMTEMDNKFDALYGTYTMKGEKSYESFSYSSFPNRGVKSELTRKVVGNKLYLKGFTQDEDGKQFISYDEVYERVK